MSLAELAKAWNVPIEGDNTKFMSVNIKALCAALSQKAGSSDQGTSSKYAVFKICFKAVILAPSCT